MFGRTNQEAIRAPFHAVNRKLGNLAPMSACFRVG